MALTNPTRFKNLLHVFPRISPGVKKERPGFSVCLEEGSHECFKNKNLIKNVRIQGLYYNLPYKKSRVPLEGAPAASTGRLEVFVDASKAVLLVFRGHFDEVA